MDEWTNRRTSGRINERTNGRRNEWMDERMIDGRVVVWESCRACSEHVAHVGWCFKRTPTVHSLSSADPRWLSRGAADRYMISFLRIPQEPLYNKRNNHLLLPSSIHKNWNLNDARILEFIFRMPAIEATETMVIRYSSSLRRSSRTIYHCSRRSETNIQMHEKERSIAIPVGGKRREIKSGKTP